MIGEVLPGFWRRRDPRTGEVFAEVALRGERLVEHPQINKGTAFPRAEREALGLVGLLPAGVTTLDRQVERVLWSYAHQEEDLERYLHLMAVLDRNETLFYRLLRDRLEDLLPIVYTPTVGVACQNFGRIFRRTRGLYLTPEDTGCVGEILARWPARDVGVVVVTDGERVLGLGDLGAGGMGISIGKASLYAAAGGIHPARLLPVCLDVGTSNEGLRADPLYLGRDRPRVRGAAYDALVDAFVAGVGERWPRALIQFEDFASGNAIRLLDRHASRSCCFNDDIQGTGAVTRAGVLAGLALSGVSIQEARIVVVGAGSAGVGIARALIDSHLWVVDALGLLTADRTDLLPEHRPLARSEAGGDLAAVVRRVRPHVLIGVTGARGAFTRQVLSHLAGPRPLVFPLSNPTQVAECTPDEARAATEGRAVVATGSPFPGVPQCNNVYVFPGVGLGVLIAEATRVSDEMFRVAAQTLSALAPPAGGLFPPLSRMPETSATIARAVAAQAIAEGVAPARTPEEIEHRLRDALWDPVYVPYRVVS